MNTLVKLQKLRKRSTFPTNARGALLSRFNGKIHFRWPLLTLKSLKIILIMYHPKVPSNSWLIAAYAHTYIPTVLCTERTQSVCIVIQHRNHISQRHVPKSTTYIVLIIIIVNPNV